MKVISYSRFGHGQVLVRRKNKSIIFNCGYNRFHRGIKKWDQGLLIQEALEFLSADEREFLLTGLTPDEWDKMFE